MWVEDENLGKIVIREFYLAADRCQIVEKFLFLPNAILLKGGCRNIFAAHFCNLAGRENIAVFSVINCGS